MLADKARSGQELAHMAEAGAIVPAGCLLASNTSSIPIMKLAAQWL